MVCISRWGKSSLRAWILCTSLIKWYAAQYWKKVVSVHGLCVPVQENSIQRTFGKSNLNALISCTGLGRQYVAHDGEKVVSVHGLCAQVQDDGMQFTMGKKQSQCMDFLYRSRTMVCSSRWGRSSLCTWTLCIGLRKWYVAQDRKKVFSVHGVCTLVQDNGIVAHACNKFTETVYRCRTMICNTRCGKSSLCTYTLCTDLGQWYVVQDAEKVISLHGLCLQVYDNGIQLTMGKKQSPYIDFVSRSRKCYVAHDGETVVFLRGLCVPIQDNSIQITMGTNQSLCMDFVYQSRKMVCSAR